MDPVSDLILCPVDFSPASDHALQAAMRLADRLGADLHLVHVYQLPIFVDPDGALISGGGDVRTHLSGEAQRLLDERAARHGEVKLHEHLAEGLPHDEINRVAEEQGATLIVMGTHGRTGLKRMLLGSVAERVVRTSPIPVITIPPPQDGEEPLAAVRRIACPVDFSDVSKQAIALALELGERLGAEEVELLHVFQLPLSFVADTGPLLDAEVLATLRAQRAQDMDALLAEHRDAPVKVSGRVLEGVDYATVVKTLEAGAHQLVVMTTHGRGGAMHLLLGSVAERVVRTSPVPVCTMRAAASA